MRTVVDIAEPGVNGLRWQEYIKDRAVVIERWMHFQHALHQVLDFVKGAVDVGRNERR